MVGAVVPSFDYALYARTTSAMQSVLDPAGYSMVLAEHHYDLDAEVRITEQLVSHGVDASHKRDGQPDLYIMPLANAIERARKGEASNDDAARMQALLAG